MPSYSPAAYESTYSPVGRFGASDLRPYGSQAGVTMNYAGGGGLGGGALLAEEHRELPVELPVAQILQHPLVLRLHDALHGAVVVRGIVVAAVGGEDGSAVEQVREDVGVVHPGVLGLNVIQPPVVADVVVVSE